MLSIRLQHNIFSMKHSFILNAIRQYRIDLSFQCNFSYHASSAFTTANFLLFQVLSKLGKQKPFCFSVIFHRPMKIEMIMR